MNQSENRDLRTGMKIGIHGPIRNIDLWTTQKYRVRIWLEYRDLRTAPNIRVAQKYTVKTHILVNKLVKSKIFKNALEFNPFILDR